MLGATKILLLLALLLGGCATMNRSECVNADWQMIGLEDGARGRVLDYIGQHRKACAEYNVSPDLEQYQQGRAQGLLQYCTYERGVQLGQRGAKYRNICPPERLQNYELGYRRGRELYALSQEIKGTHSSIAESYQLLEELDGERLHKEEVIVDGKTSKAVRAVLLEDVKLLQSRIDMLETEILLLEEQKASLVSERNLLKQQYQAGPL